MRKYIKQVDSKNFVYPNNTIQEYDREIIHTINNNQVSGTVTNFSATTITSTSIVVTFNYTWSSNGAEKFFLNSGFLSILSVHAMVAGQSYLKPFRLINRDSSSTNVDTKSGTLNVTLTPSQFGLSSFVNGVYQLEVRMIGKKTVQPICISFTVNTLVPPTPTPTPSPMPVSPTPTPTPTPVTSSFTSGATLNVTNVGYIKYTDTNNTTQFQYIGSTGAYTLTACTICSSIYPGYPLSNPATFTVTNCGTTCSGGPVVTPSPTPSTLPPLYYRLTDCQTYTNYYSQQFPSGTFNSGDRVEGSSGYYYVVSGTYSSPPAGMEQRYVSGTGQSGCP